MNSKYKLATLLAIIIEIYSLNALNLDDFCKLPLKKSCITKYGDAKPKIKCHFDACQKPFVYKCGQDKCARNQRECERLLEYEKFADSNMLQTVNQLSQLSENSKKAFSALVFEIESFRQKITVCAKKPEILEPNDICISGKSCYKISKTNNLIFGGIQNLSKIDCSCKGSHSFYCSVKNCTLNERTCKLLNKKQVGNKKVILKLKNCDDNFMLIE